jgi:hypothetical protein
MYSPAASRHSPAVAPAQASKPVNGSVLPGGSAAALAELAEDVVAVAVVLAVPVLVLVLALGAVGALVELVELDGAGLDVLELPLGLEWCELDGGFAPLSGSMYC